MSKHVPGLVLRGNFLPLSEAFNIEYAMNHEEESNVENKALFQCS